MATNLLPPNATTLERNVAATNAALGDLPTPLRDMMDPDTCPLRLLPWLAWAMSVDNWNDTWNEAQKRAVIKSSRLVHKKKGTLGAVEDALAALGVSAEIIEWFNDVPRATPHTFRVDLGIEKTGVTTGFLASMEQQIVSVKPARSHFKVRLIAKSRAQVYQAAAFSDAVITSIYPQKI